MNEERKANEASQSIMLLQAQKGGYQKQRKEESSNDKKVNWMKKEKQMRLLNQ